LLQHQLSDKKTYFRQPIRRVVPNNRPLYRSTYSTVEPWLNVAKDKGFILMKPRLKQK